MATATFAGAPPGHFRYVLSVSGIKSTTASPVTQTLFIIYSFKQLIIKLNQQAHTTQELASFGHKEREQTEFNPVVKSKGGQKVCKVLFCIYLAQNLRLLIFNITGRIFE
ncbi:hypothetical protein GCM10007932_06110 [Vibrio penaeicida]|uniref:Uncharacterized protein n=1 Tax=Vibrio penaeicida TaxID=104609 RepID=A0AAV5NMH8_9VIBR|nr:hypothetical protein GCM10007932_06110 [Vibrio penaeicida]